jgi:hypothetical protein
MGDPFGMELPFEDGGREGAELLAEFPFGEGNPRRACCAEGLDRF